MYRVVERFVSINGEGIKAGQLAVFVRFWGCNLSCAYCDTKWANAADTPYIEMTAAQIAAAVAETGVKNVTLTGGEPLRQPELAELIVKLAAQGNDIEIETNGSLPLAKVLSWIESPAVSGKLSFTMDYKLGASGMEACMLTENFQVLRQYDTVKFVAGSHQDLCRAAAVIREYHLTQRCHVYLSPVFGAIDPAEMVDFMKEQQMNGVNLQLQLHKIIWAPDKRGV